MAFDLENARQFIAQADIPKPLLTSQGAEETPVFASLKDQAAVVGQDIFAFASGTDSKLRSAISDSALLAQLIADQQIPDRKDVTGWYDAYFAVLRTVGWVVQDGGWSEISEAGDGFEVHEKILDIAAVLLAGAPTALAVITATLNALKSASDDSPWITLFHRRAIKGESARFQISLVQPSGDGALLVSLIAFALKSETVVTKILLFKVTKSRASLRNNSAQVSINLDALRDLAPDIRAKVRGWQRSYIAALPDLGPPPGPE